MLLRATLLQAFFAVRSERQLMEQIDCNLLFRWFVGLPMDAGVWHRAVFSHNRDRLMTAEVAQEFLSGLLALRQVKALLSADHFSVDGALPETWDRRLGQHEKLSPQGRFRPAARAGRQWRA